MIVPPITGKTIWNNCVGDDFTDDPYLTELYDSGEIERYTIKKYKTAASSRVWNQEEEVCTYRDLILGQISNEDRQKGYMYILDTGKLKDQWFDCQSRNKKSRLFCS